MAEAFDVYVEGGKDRSPSGMAALATAIAARYKMPPEAVAAAVGKGRFRVGKGLDRSTADRLVKQLDDLGAMTLMHPSGTSLPPLPAPPPADAAPTLPSVHPPTALDSPGARSDRRTMTGTPSPRIPGPMPGPAPETSTSEPTSPGRSVRPSANQIAIPSAASISLGFLDGEGDPADQSGDRTDDAPPPRAGSERPARAVAPAGRGRPSASVPRSAFGPGSDGGASAFAADVRLAPPSDDAPLELDVPQAPARAAADFGLPAPPDAEDDAEGEDIAPPPQERPPAPLRPMLNDPELPEGNPNIVRCSQHGLMYDRTRTNGCRKCLEPPRHTASRDSRRPLLTLGDLKHHDVKRAFVGLAVALFLGFVPTALYAWGSNETAVERLRAEQVEISKRPGTAEVVQAYDQIDEDIDNLRSSGAWKAFFLWAAVTGAAMVGWYKATDKYLV